MEFGDENIFACGFICARVHTSMCILTGVSTHTGQQSPPCIFLNHLYFISEIESLTEPDTCHFSSESPGTTCVWPLFPELPHTRLWHGCWVGIQVSMLAQRAVSPLSQPHQPELFSWDLISHCSSRWPWPQSNRPALASPQCQVYRGEPPNSHWRFSSKEYSPRCLLRPTESTRGRSIVCGCRPEVDSVQPLVSLMSSSFCC